MESISEAVGIAPDNWTLKLAVFHTLFNLTGVILMTPAIPPMVRFLERFVQGAGAAERLEPLYLNESALQHPDTAMEVLIKETGHLFDNAFEIVAHAINVHRSDILSKRPLDMVVHKSRTPFDLDVMTDYYESIKLIYNAIVEFATRARVAGMLTASQSEEIDSIRIACRHIAQVVKDISGMRDNLILYLNSDNEHITREYDMLRLRIASDFREIYRLRTSKDEVDIFMSLTQLEEDAAEADVLSNGTLDRLVRDDLITDQMATSLMNDSEFTHDICVRLIKVALRMSVAQGTELKEIGTDLLQAEPSAA